jgi:signal transduction histidine kinase
VAWAARGLDPGPANAVAVLLVGHDVTELQEAQRHALQAERLAAVGQMVAGLAHESRNALQRIQANLERLSWKLHGRGAEVELLGRAQQAQDDLTRLFEEVRGYAAPLPLVRRPCDLGDVWRDAWQQVRAVHPDKSAELREQAAGLDLVCEADRFRLGQVFRNILENAFAACSSPVRVEVACRETVLAGRPAVEVAVRDNGPGLDAEQRRRIFEPFYTTKVKGTGLGMAIAKRVVETHGGQLAAGEAPGSGAEIRITLPRKGP